MGAREPVPHHVRDEARACDALAEAGVIPAEAAKAVRDRGDKPYTPDRIARIDEIEAETKHDVIAFLPELSEQVGEEARCAPTRETLLAPL